VSSTLDDGDDLTPSIILADLSDAGTLDLVIPFDRKDERKALAHKMRKLRRRNFTDTIGRRFKFGHREGSPGAPYGITFFVTASAEQSKLPVRPTRSPPESVRRTNART